MTRKRFIKLMMSKGFSRNALNNACRGIIKERDRVNSFLWRKRRVEWAYLWKQYVDLGCAGNPKAFNHNWRSKNFDYDGMRGAEG